MNTHDIELPPLPEARIVSYQTDSTMRRMELRTYSDKDMKDYARAAIVADRKRRGEPVMAKHQPCGCVICTCEDNEQCHGCGAHHCGKHPIAKFSNPVYEPSEPIRGEPVAWPKTASEIRDFIGNHYAGMEGDDDPSDNDKYTLTAHDLLSAFRWWGQGSGHNKPIATVITHNNHKLLSFDPGALDELPEGTILYAKK